MSGSMVERLRASARDVGAWPAALRVLTGVLGAATVALSAVDGGVFGVVAVVLVTGAVFVLAALVAEPGDRRFVLVAALALLLAREIGTCAFDLITVARSGTHVFAPDEGLYLRLADNIVANWRDPNVYVNNEDGNIQSEYVRTIARVFFVIGPDVPVIKILDTALAVLLPLFVYRTMVNLRLSGRRWTLLILLVFPSLVLWSALVLKDAYVWFFVSAVVWSSSEYIRSRNPWWHLVTLFALLPIESVRRYIFVTMAIAWLFIVFAVPARERIRAAAVTTSTLIAILLLMNPLRDLGLNALYLPIAIRQGAATGRTTFVETPSIQGDPGDRIVITVAGQTPPPGTTPREVVVQPGSQIVFEGSPPPAGGGAVVVVRPGDIVRIATPRPVAGVTSPTPTVGATASATVEPSPTETPPSATPRAVVLNPAALNTVTTKPEADSDSRSASSSLMSNLRHLPTGIAFLVGAPFPWAARTGADLLTIPEVLLWYACVIFAVIGLVGLVRRRDLRFAHGVAALAGMGIIFALIEANVGTLLRSRDMMIPFTVVLTGAGIDMLLRSRPGLLPAWTARSMRDGG